MLAWCAPRLIRLLSEQGLPGSGRLADREPCGTGPLCIFTLIASKCHMYLEHCINNNPKQQEEDYTSYRELRSKWENSQQNSRTKCLASWGLKAKQTRGVGGSSGHEPPLCTAHLPGAAQRAATPGLAGARHPSPVLVGDSKVLGISGAGASS